MIAFVHREPEDRLCKAFGISIIELIISLVVDFGEASE